MLKREHFPQVFGVATLALIFSAASVYPQVTTDSNASPAGSGSSAQTSPGSASSGGSGPTSATGQSGTSSSGASSAGGSSAASGASDKAAAGDKSAAGGLSKSDQNIMRQMAYANLAEIETGKLAQSNSKNEQVRTFAQQMIDDHTKAQEELQQLADAKGVKLPTEPDSKHKAAMKKLSSLSGDAFDKGYMKQGGVNDHRQTHKLLQNAQKKASDPDLQALAQKTLPTIEQHLKLAKETSAGKSGAAQASGSSGSTDTSGGSGGASGSGAPGGAGSKSDTGK
jgi:putative membrane protein